MDRRPLLQSESSEVSKPGLKRTENSQNLSGIEEKGWVSSSSGQGEKGRHPFDKRNWSSGEMREDHKETVLENGTYRFTVHEGIPELGIEGCNDTENIKALEGNKGDEGSYEWLESAEKVLGSDHNNTDDFRREKLQRGYQPIPAQGLGEAVSHWLYSRFSPLGRREDIAINAKKDIDKKNQERDFRHSQYFKNIIEAIEKAHQINGLEIEKLEKQLEESRNYKKKNCEYGKTQERYKALEFQLSAFNEKEAEKDFEKTQTEAARLEEEVRLFRSENPSSRLEVYIEYSQTYCELFIEREKQATSNKEVQDDNSINRIHPVNLQFNFKDITNLEQKLKSLKEKCDENFESLKKEIEILDRKMLFFDEGEFKNDYKNLSSELKLDSNKESNDYKDKENSLKALDEKWKNHVHLQNLKLEKKACLALLNLQAVKVELYDYHELFSLKKELGSFDEQEEDKRKDLEVSLKNLKDQQKEIVSYLRKKFTASTDGLYGDELAKGEKEKGKEKGKESDMNKNTLSAIKSFTRLGVLGSKILF